MGSVVGGKLGRKGVRPDFHPGGRRRGRDGCPGVHGTWGWGGGEGDRRRIGPGESGGDRGRPGMGGRGSEGQGPSGGRGWGPGGGEGRAGRSEEHTSETQ